jgi:opacity protein-like surface antigen
MKTICVVIGILLMTALCGAQDTSSWRIYGGYQYARIDTHAVQDALNLLHVLDPTVPQLDFGAHQNLSGWDFGVEENMNHWLGGVVDASGSYGTKSVNLGSVSGVSVSSRTKMRVYTLMAGPQLTYRRHSNLQPFARALFGGAFANDSTNIVANNVPLIEDVKESDEGFAIGGGGGVDVFFSSHVGARVTVDYIRTYLFNDTQGNFRGTAGIVFRF